MDIEFASILAIVNSAAMNTGVHISFQTMVSSGYVPRSGTAESNGSSSIFSFFKEPPYCSPCGWTNLHSHSVGGFSFLHTFSSIHCL